MTELTTICFMGTTEQKTLLGQWARESDRSVSYIIRLILDQEAKRRSQGQQSQAEPATTQQNH